MGNGIDGPPDVKPVEWRRLRRVNSHRTSRPTDEAIRKAVGEIAAERGNAPAVDAVILAAVRMAVRNMGSLLDAIREIEQAGYQAAPPPPHEPGA